jgi:hypothetical protein
VDQHHWQSEEGYRVCVSHTPGQSEVWLAWAPRDPERPRTPGALLGHGVPRRDLAQAQCEVHLARSTPC